MVGWTGQCYRGNKITWLFLLIGPTSLEILANIKYCANLIMINSDIRVFHIDFRLKLHHQTPHTVLHMPLQENSCCRTEMWGGAFLEKLLWVLVWSPLKVIRLKKASVGCCCSSDKCCSCFVSRSERSHDVHISRLYPMLHGEGGSESGFWFSSITLTLTLLINLMSVSGLHVWRVNL